MQMTTTGSTTISVRIDATHLGHATGRTSRRIANRLTSIGVITSRRAVPDAP